MGADTMRVLATIPELVTAQADAEPAVVTPVAPLEPAGTIRVCPRPSFPWASVAALALVAVAVWSIAGWRDARRLARQQAEERLASQAPITASETTLR
jgi:hypothetical protein